MAERDALFVLSINEVHYERAGFAEKFETLGTAIKGLSMPKVRIYGENNDPEHKDDLAYLTMFLKA